MCFFLIELGHFPFLFLLFLSILTWRNDQNCILKRIKRMINPLQLWPLPNFCSHELTAWYPMRAIFIRNKKNQQRNKKNRVNLMYTSHCNLLCKLPCRRERCGRCRRHWVERSHNQVMCPHIFDDFHRSKFWNQKKNETLNNDKCIHNGVLWRLRSIYPAIFTAFRIRILALSNSRFTTHALAATRSTSMAIL